MKTICKLPLFGFLLAIAATASAGTVKMKTAKAVGEKLTIAVNVGVPLTLKWGDGSTETLTSTGQPQEVTVKNASLTLSGEKDITSLYVAENDLTELTLTDVSTLKTLICCQNQLTTLDLSSCKELVSLDCQGNNLTSLKTESGNIVDLNIADNQLTASGLRSATYAANVTSLVCSNNKLSTVAYLSSMTGLKTLFCQNNQVSSLGLSKCTQLEILMANDNALKSFNAASLGNLKELWMGNNQLTELDLSAQPLLEGLSVPDNLLTLITWNKNCSAKLQYADLSGNGLFLNSFPSIYDTSKKVYVVDAALEQKEPYELFTELNVNEKTEALQSKLSRNAWNGNVTSTMTLTDANGVQLVKDEDYVYSAYRFTFKKPFTGVVITLMPNNYMDVVLKTKPFNVVDPTGIAAVDADEETASGKVYDLQGRKVSESGLRDSQLPKGIYVIGGKKVVVR